MILVKSILINNTYLFNNLFTIKIKNILKNVYLFSSIKIGKLNTIIIGQLF